MGDYDAAESHKIVEGDGVVVNSYLEPANQAQLRFLGS